jgi:hypothetical protein
MSTVSVDISSGSKVQVKLSTTVDGLAGETLEHRLLLLDSGVEKERISISPLMVKEEVDRDGNALANQVADSQLSVVMYLIALGAMSYAVWTMVQMRRIKRGDDLDESDQTAEVVENMDGKVLPVIDTPNASLPVPVAAVPPLPPSGLPVGWTMEQWSHYGQQYIESMGPNQQ